MYCHKCGARLEDGCRFCHKCGTQVVPTTQEAQPPRGAAEETSSACPVPQQSAPSDRFEATDVPSDGQTGPPSDSWWSRRSKISKLLIVLGAVIVGLFVLWGLIVFLQKFGVILFGIVLIGVLAFSLFHGSETERAEARKTAVQVVVGFFMAVLIAVVVFLKGDVLLDLIYPGAEVRNAYLSQYSNSVTVEDAFEDFFADEAWDAYEEGGYSYVTFTGTCEWMGEAVDARITFQITGEQFVIQGLDINGRPQSDLILYALLAAVYEEE